MAEVKTEIYELIKPGAEHQTGSLNELVAGRALLLLSLLDQGYDLNEDGYSNNPFNGAPKLHGLLERFDDLIFLREEQLRKENEKYGVREPETAEEMARTIRRIAQLRENAPQEVSPAVAHTESQVTHPHVHVDTRTGVILTPSEAEQSLQDA